MFNSHYKALKHKIESLALKINAPDDLLPTFIRSDDGALPHIVIDENGIFHLIVVERGQEIDHRSTKSEDELLYWVFVNITFSMACKFELHNRIPNQDVRRLLFKHQETLLGKLSEAWRLREIDAHNSILQRYPFNDEQA